MPMPPGAPARAPFRLCRPATAAWALPLAVLVAAAAAAAAADAADGQCGGEGIACPAATAAEDSEETALLAHRRVARELQEEIRLAQERRPRKTRPRAAARADDCTNEPDGWKDSHGHGCLEYVSEKWCTSSQGYGSGWWSFWGSFGNYATHGVDAAEACCGCGGGTATKPSEACHVTESSDDMGYGIEFYFHTDGSSTGCAPASCTPQNFLAEGLPKVIDAFATEYACGCWASAAEQAEDGSAAQPEHGERVFLFSYVKGDEGNCSAQMCWQKYAQVLDMFKTGYLSQKNSTDTDKSADGVLAPEHWVAKCGDMPEGDHANQANGLMPVSALVNALISWDATLEAEGVLQIASIVDEMTQDQVVAAQRGQGSLPPPTMKSVIGAFAVNWEKLAYKTAKWLLRMLTNLLNIVSGGKVHETVVLDTSFNTKNYFGLMVEFLVAGIIGKDSMKQWYLILSNGGKVADGPGPNTTGYYAYEDVKAMLQGLGAKIEAGTVVRENELGMQVLNGALWPEAPGGKQSIFLGASREAHAFVRPLLADVLDNAQGAPGSTCDGSTCWDAAWLREQARAFFANRTSMKSDDLKWYVTKVLHKVHLNIDLSDEEAQAFADYKTKAVIGIPFPQTLMDSSSTIRSAVQLPDVQAARSTYLERFKPAIQAKFPGVTFSEEDLALTAAAFLDSLQFAGGLSVPAALTFVLALTHQKEKSKWPALKGVKLDSTNMEGILWEAMRLYPPVAGFPYWEMVNGSWHHQLPNVDMAMLDETLFDDPDVFKIRPLDFRKEHSIGWVDFATYPSGVSAESIRAPHSHRCPGKELSLQLMLTFLEEFVAAGSWMRKEKDITVNSYSPTPFTLYRMPENVCWKPAAECVSSFVYNFKTYHGCTKDDNHHYWCSHNSLYLPFQWSECTPTAGPCGDSEKTADAVDATQLMAMQAAADCSEKGGSKRKKAKCVCAIANDFAKASERVQACTDLSAVAYELGGPWSCTVRKVQGKKTCRAFAPWYRRVKNRISKTWDSVKTWGEGLVPTNKCYPTNNNTCAQLALTTKVVKCDKVTADTLSRDWLDMPEQLRGVFWMASKGESGLVSFGRTNDGAGLSPGSLGKDGVYKVRLAGDKAWSFLKTGSGASSFAEATDLVFTFTFDSAEDPTSAEILPSARRALGASVPPWLVSAKMTLVSGGSAAYPGSVVWQHRADVLGKDAQLFDYQVVQVIDGDGNPLPAFNDFVSFCDDHASSGVGSPGKLWYNSYEMEPFKTSTIKQELGRCPFILGFSAPKIVSTAYFLAKRIPGFDIRDVMNSPPIDPYVYDSFTFVSTLGVIHSQLAPFGGAYELAKDRMCLPWQTRPLNKVEEFGSLSSLEEIDALEGECAPQVAYRFDLITMCGASIQSSLPWNDGMGSNSNNTWAKALKDHPNMTKQEHVMSYYEPFKNKDGDPIYPALEFDWWSTFRISHGNWDDAFEMTFTLDTLGSHLVQEVAGTPPSRGGATAALVVKLDLLSGLKIRPNFAPWGSNMYFTADGMPLCVEQNTLGGAPEFVWADSPAAEWQYAKFVFRSSLMNAVTAVDHLWFSHMSVSNPLAMAAREVLLPSHPLRRLLAAVTFGSIDVNADAQQVLLGRSQFLHRASPYESWEEVHEAAEDLIQTFESYFGAFLDPALHAQLHPRMQQAPFYADGPLLMKVISDMIEGYFVAMGDGWCDAETDAIKDQNLQDFANYFEDWFETERPDRAAANLKWLRGADEAPWTCGAVKKLLKCQLFTVSGFHQHVGKVADYVRDPELVGVSWAPGEMAARPRQAMLYSLVSAATGYKGVTINSDFKFMLKGIENEAALKGVMSKFQADLNAILPTLRERNEARRVPYTRMQPDRAEISLYQ